MSTQNRNLETGIRYGIISASSLDSEIIDMIERNGDNLTADEALKQIRLDVNKAVDAGEVEEDDFDAEVDRRMTEWSENASEEVYRLVEGEGNTRLEVQTTWLGGAQLVWVFRSPHMTYRGLCSPCVPNALDLDTPFDPHGHLGYDVPPDWRRKD